MELGEVMGLQGLAVAAPAAREGDTALPKRAAFTQPAAAAAAVSYPSPFLDQQKMLRFSKAAQALPSGLDAFFHHHNPCSSFHFFRCSSQSESKAKILLCCMLLFLPGHLLCKT